MQHKIEQFERLLKIMDQLREKCPWDREQTFQSLRHLTIEETYELAEAILNNDLTEVKKELGDILLHIVFYAKIAEEQNAFDIAGVIDSLCEKLIYRHPHVFSDTQADSALKVSQNWEAIKLKEKGRSKRVLDGVPKALPAMVKANRIQDKVRGVGFDWDEKEQVWEKVKEEFNELEYEIKADSKPDMEKEFGDLFFSMINAARLYDIDPEAALERTNQKFIRRFRFLEDQTLLKGKSLHDMSLDEMNDIWEKAKETDI